MSTKILWALLAALLLSQANGARAAKTVPGVEGFLASSAFTLKVLGDSSLHKWEAGASQLTITGSLKPGKGDLQQQVVSGGVKGLKVSVAVEGLKSTEGAGMDSKMHEAMDAAEFPGISFELKSYAVSGLTVTAQGTLTIHGAAKEVELKGMLAPTENGVAVKGSYGLLMSDYGIKPPVMMLGTIRVANKVTIAYDYVLKPVKP